MIKFFSFFSFFTISAEQKIYSYCRSQQIQHTIFFLLLLKTFTFSLERKHFMSSNCQQHYSCIWGMLLSRMRVTWNIQHCNNGDNQMTNGQVPTGQRANSCPGQEERDGRDFNMLLPNSLQFKTYEMFISLKCLFLKFSDHN